MCQQLVIKPLSFTLKDRGCNSFLISIIFRSSLFNLIAIMCMDATSLECHTSLPLQVKHMLPLVCLMLFPGQQLQSIL
jgi:hypothetical protein